jgi:hypothetical protein
MPYIEKTIYPRFSDEFLSPLNIKEYFLPTDEEIHFVHRHARTEQGILNLLILLKTHQFLGQTISLSKIPMPIQKYLQGYLNLSKDVLPFEEQTLHKASIHRYRKAIRNFLQVKPWSDDVKTIIIKLLETSALTMSAPADLINVSVEFLLKNNYELPAFSTLDRLVKHIRQQVHEQIFKQTTISLTNLQRDKIDDLLQVSDSEWQSDFNKIKAVPKKNTLTQMRLWHQRLEWLNSIINPANFIQDIPFTKIRQFASQTDQLELGDLKDIRQADKRHTFLLCFLHQAQTRTRDELIMMFLKRMRKTHYQAKERLKSLQVIKSQRGEFAHENNQFTK